MSEKITLADVRNAKTDEEKQALSKQWAEQSMEQAKRGTLELSEPLKDGDRVFERLEYDFFKLSGMEYVKAMDTAGNNRNAYQITNEQALALFCAAAAHCQEGLFANDIRDGLTNIMDVMNAVKIGSLFFNVTSTAGGFRISNT